tara:strand:- start:208 stop:474 length:267 start_codon:yes stop_codon:yes gene_type:complete
MSLQMEVVLADPEEIQTLLEEMVVLAAVLEMQVIHLMQVVQVFLVKETMAELDNPEDLVAEAVLVRPEEIHLMVLVVMVQQVQLQVLL